MRKSFTVAGVMVMVDEGRLSLLDPVEQFLPEFRRMKVKPCAESHASQGCDPVDAAGMPFSVLAGIDRRLVRVALDHADTTGPVAVYNSSSRTSKIAKYFNTGAFALRARVTFGSSSRNFIHGPGYENSDAGLFKVVPIAEDRRLEFRWETFNTLNHSILSNPKNSFSSSAFGRITASTTGRVMQFAAKLGFLAAVSGLVYQGKETG
jgi:Beta-lactamase